MGSSVSQRIRLDGADVHELFIERSSGPRVPETNTTSMSRTTGLPCAIVARMIARGQINQTGVIPPELLARRPDFVTSVLVELARRGVKFEQRFEKL